jgi:HNH endonuclease
MTPKPIGAGVLFQDAARSRFLLATGRQYDNMLARVKRKGFYGLPFTKEQFRAYLLTRLGDLWDGFVRCPYCTGFFAIEQVAIDHRVPLSRGGGVELDNLDIPCRACNARKGSMTPGEYRQLLEFLDTKIPLAKTGVLQRLEISVQLAAADRVRRRKEKERASQ